MKTEMKSSLKLFVRPFLVVLGFMLLYALVHVALGFYAKKDSASISQNSEKTEIERQNSALPPKQEEANATTTATEENPTKDPPLPSETPTQKQENKQETKQEQEKENEPKQNSASPIQNNQKTPTTPTIGKKPLEYKVAVSGVNVRAFPSTKGKIIGSLAKDKSVKVLEIQNDWAKIEFSNETKGYVFLKLLKKAE
ncbi:SH3 domain-containing protein [Helicobacter pylori]|uniref:SH3 domain-containing protein n=1 Tax=Helicobacter pylori TaxID=210 RepID=UPI0019224E77|nr:SH3 domain-containing protein [Helicobacter pylori]QQW62173.1 SH3 domain-containing protein [Helicobacter pylori]QQW63634.1 SH3 domain-containing protein [Helicobacter pylori]QQW66560.1 SH3 domain-containing protein [Helicobacter pylori]QQW68011.1 SH3 domain-containing protein [Helicobacter pylori]QQW95559.1 SH3 domain-containing protein [Helicobacter pylori]